MDNKSIYKKTIKFSLWRALWDFLAFAIFTIFAAATQSVVIEKTN